MKIKNRSELNFGILIWIVNLLYLFLTVKIKVRSEGVSSRTIPYILCLILGVLGAVQIFKGLNMESKIIKKNESVDKKTVLKVSLLILGYILIFEYIGFLLSTINFLFFMFLILSPENQKINKKRYLFISSIISLSVYIFFKYSLDIMLPEGILGGI